MPTSPERNRAEPRTKTPLRVAAMVTLAAGPLVFGLLLFKHLSYPLMWNDEAETAVYGQRVLEYGYPKVHGPRNTLYPSPLPEEVGIHDGLDAYVATTWGHFYVAAIGVALAADVDDPYERTLSMRLPFALLGGLGLWALVVAVLPALPGSRARLVFTGFFFWLACAQVSLILHLREVRHPPLILLASSLAVLGWVRLRERGGIHWMLLATGSLVAVYCTFYPAYLALGLGLLADALLTPKKGASKSRPESTRRAQLTALALSLALVTPLLVFFDALRVSLAHARLAPFDLQVYVENLGAIATFLLRYEHLGLLLVVRVGLLATARMLPGTRPDASEQPLRALARTLLVLVGVYALVMSTNPSLFERYLTPLGPWISAAVLLDGYRLGARLRAGAQRVRRRALSLEAAVLAGAALTLSWHAPAMADRWYEIWNRYRGPMDESVAFVRQQFPEPSELVVATNYEDAVWMFYLGARVRRPEEVRGARIIPDVVVPRRGHVPERLSSLIAGGGYHEAVMSVRDLPVNNIPELHRWRPLIDYGVPTHLFRTPLARNNEEALRVYWRPWPTEDPSRSSLLPRREIIDNDYQFQ